MIRMLVSQLEPDMVLASPVRHPRIEGHVLLQADYRLHVDSINRLHRFDVQSVWIRHPGFDFLDQKLPEDIPQRRARLYDTVKKSFTGISSRTAGAFNINEYRSIIGDMIMGLVTNTDNAVWAERMMDDDSELFGHSANVAYLSLVIGMQIKEYVAGQRKFVSHSDGTDLTNLGIGAILHDIGKLGLDQRWWKTHCIDKGADKDTYRSHVIRGYEAIQGRIEATASQVVLNHHQRYDGQGFPEPKSVGKERTAKPMKGQNIHVFSRIVAVANALDALMSAGKHRGLPLVYALAAIQRPALSGMFDPVILRAGLQAVPPFPLGGSVELSDKRQAVVVDLNGSEPCQPIVRILNPHTIDAIEYEEIDLSDPGTPAITKFDGHPVGQEAFYALPNKHVRPQKQKAVTST